MHFNPQEQMYRKSDQSERSCENFELPFSEKLSPDNRWVIMAELIPWSEFEEEYAENFSEKMGAIAKPFRMAFGALIIKEKLGISDRETIEQIRENPYKDLVNKINEKMVKNFRVKEEEKSKKKTNQVK